MKMIIWSCHNIWFQIKHINDVSIMILYLTIYMKFVIVYTKAYLA